MRLSRRGSGYYWRQVGSIPPRGVVAAEEEEEEDMASVTVTLTNAQFKALPTTPVTVVAAPGAGKIIIPTACILVKNWSSGSNPYNSNTNDDNFVYLDAGGNTAFKLANETDYENYLNELLSGDDQIFILYPLLGVGSDGLETQMYTSNNAENSAIQIRADTTGGTDFTGGNAANTLKVTVYYIEHTL